MANLINKTWLVEADYSYSDQSKIVMDALSDEHEEECEKDYCSLWICDMYPDKAVYCHNGDYFEVAYTIDDNGAVKLADKRLEVIPHMTYEPEPPDAGDDGESDNQPLAMHDMGESYRRIRERNIPQSHRDKLKAGDFAGKGTSFPIETPEDVSSAARSLGRAGADNFPADTIKANIMRIARKKGPTFVAKLPKAWLAKAEAKVKPAVEAFEVSLIEAAHSLTESAELSESGGLAKIIQPGWGSSGYYPVATLRAAESAFPAGTKMYWNHPTAQEQAARPEGDLDNLVGELTTGAKYMETGPKGPGLYANMKVFERYAKDVQDLKDSIGLSIRAYGNSRMGEAEGKKGPIVENIRAADSVDYVTVAGAGGEVVTLFEAAGRRTPTPPQESEEEMTENKELLERVSKAENEIARMREANIIMGARGFVAARLKAINMPEITRGRLTEQLAIQPIVKDGKLDEAAFGAVVDTRAKEEMAYLESLVGAGRVKGMGPSATPGVEQTAEQTAKTLEESFRALGLNESTAKLAANGRA